VFQDKFFLDKGSERGKNLYANFNVLEGKFTDANGNTNRAAQAAKLPS